MSKIPIALAELHRAEDQLARDLLALSDDNKSEHAIHYIARDLARWSQEHVRELARIARDHDVDLDPEPDHDTGRMDELRAERDGLMARNRDGALGLIAELKAVHRDAAGLSLDWEVLAQTAQALKDRELLALTQDCHPQTLRQMRWANAMVKELAAQAMVTP